MPVLQRTFATLTLAAAAMAALLAYLPAAGHDQLWCLYVAHHVLGGETLYGPTLFESNPPLILWLSLLPAWLSVHTGLNAATVGKALVLLLEAAIAALTTKQLHRLYPQITRTQLTALAFTFVTVYNVLPARDLGQRDHLLALLVLPYILNVALSAQSPRLHALHPLLSAALAAIGLALKPHEALIPIALELFLVLRSRSLRTLVRPQPFILVASAVAYYEAIRHLTPRYLTTILPLLRNTYWAFGHRTLSQLFVDAIELHILLVITLTLYFLQRVKQKALSPIPYPLFPLAAMLLIAAVAATSAYDLQGTGWYYQQLPALTFASFALMLLVISTNPFATFASPPSRPLRSRFFSAEATGLPKATAALCLLAVALTTHFMNYPFTEARSFPIDNPDPAFFANLAPNTAVATLTTTVDDSVMPAARYHLTIAQRYPHLWMLPAILRNESGPVPHHTIAPDRLAELDTQQHQYMVEDLTHFHPQLILVARCQDPAVQCQVLEDRHDNLLAWFQRDPAFVTLFQHYTYTGSRGMYDAYTLRQ